MKILLASKEKWLVNGGYKYLGIPKEDLRIGRVVTALAGAADENYKIYMKEFAEDLKNTGIYFEEIDIKDKTQEEIYKFFEDKNVIEVDGGNPFYLLKYANESGFKEILDKLLGRGLIYLGFSSGSHLMSPNIVLGTLKKGRNNYGVTDLTAFGYVPYLVRPHYANVMENDIKELAQKLPWKIRLITDDQAILIEDGKETFIGGPEIILN